MMSSPSEVVAWECGACTYTNEDAIRRDCLACQIRHLVHYAIMAGATPATTARTTRVDHHTQAHFDALATAAPTVAGKVATSANAAVAGEAPTATYGQGTEAEIAAMHLGRAPHLGGNRAGIVACLVNMMADIVGTSAKDRGHNCPHHTCCGIQLQVGSKVCFHQEGLIYCKGREEDVLTVYIVGDSMMTCKVGFLPLHLLVSTDAYNGLHDRIVSIYYDCSMNVLKREKFWCNKSCCIACILGNPLVFSIVFYRNDTS
jgi:hypothetical protein